MHRSLLTPLIAPALLLAGCAQPDPEPPPAPPPPATQSGPLKTFAWSCLTNGYVVTDYRQTEEAMWLFLPSNTVLLPREASASGAKYSNGDITFFSKGNEAILTTAEGDDHCVEKRRASILEDAKLRGVDYRGNGNEPGWVLEISGNRMDFVTNYGQDAYEFTISGHEREPDSSTVTYTSTALGKAIRVSIIGEPCNDTMADEVYETAVRIELDERVYQGCGQGLH